MDIAPIDLFRRNFRYAVDCQAERPCRLIEGASRWELRRIPAGFPLSDHRDPGNDGGARGNLAVHRQLESLGRGRGLIADLHRSSTDRARRAHHGQMARQSGLHQPPDARGDRCRTRRRRRGPAGPRARSVAGCNARSGWSSSASARTWAVCSMARRVVPRQHCVALGTTARSAGSADDGLVGSVPVKDRPLTRRAAFEQAWRRGT